MKTAFIDRDGTIVQNSGFINSPQQMVQRPFVRLAIRGMQNLIDCGWQIIVVTNQGGVGAGFITESTLREINALLIGRLAERGIFLRNFRYCPHHPQAKCGCRKPLPGMLQLSAAEDDATLEESIMIGDDDCDIAAGQAAGVKATYRVGSEAGWEAFDLSKWPE